MRVNTDPYGRSDGKGVAEMTTLRDGIRLHQQWTQAGPVTTTLAAVPALLVFGGIGQFIAGLVAYRKGTTFAATAFCSFGANNVVVSTFFLFQAIGLMPKNGETMTLLAIDLFCFAYIAFVLFLASFKLNGAFVLVLLALFAGYGLAAVGNLSSMPVVIGQIGGWFLIVSAGLAFVPMWPRSLVGERPAPAPAPIGGTA
jgi:succinate-acetate transporter protein